MICKICNHESKHLFQGKILGKYKITYFHCRHCGFLQTEEPYWLIPNWFELIFYLLITMSVTLSVLLLTEHFIFSSDGRVDFLKKFIVSMLPLYERK